MSDLSRRRFLAASAGLTGAALLGCRGSSSGTTSPESTTTFYGDTFDAFATSLYGELRKKDGNVFFSPYSISTALAMTAAGARGNTLTQMQKVLGLPQDKPVIDALAQRGKSKTLGKDSHYELVTANALWPQTGFNWSAEYLKSVTETFQASVTETDYSANPESARKRINEWVEKQTRNTIKELLAGGTIDGLTRMVLINAIYFKGTWLEVFDVSKTREDQFTLLDGTKKKLQMMTRNDTIDYFEDKQIQMIRLPYKGEEVSFLAMLPTAPEDFAKLDAAFSIASLKKWCAGLKPEGDAHIHLPRFKIEADSVLNEPLIGLGMTDAFRNDTADFSGMVTSGRGYSLSLVQHKAGVEVNETGTEAVAASSAVAFFNGGPHFRADRPFLFALRHEPTGTILFMGRYSNPV